MCPDTNCNGKFDQFFLISISFLTTAVAKQIFFSKLSVYVTEIPHFHVNDVWYKSQHKDTSIQKSNLILSGAIKYCSSVEHILYARFVCSQLYVHVNKNHRPNNYSISWHLPTTDYLCRIINEMPLLDSTEKELSSPHTSFQPPICPINRSTISAYLFECGERFDFCANGRTIFE